LESIADASTVDDAMTERNRSSNGTLIENRTKFPNGLANLAQQLQAEGLTFGVYSSAGRFTCGGYPGSLGYETQDATWWAGLGAGYLKLVSVCPSPQNLLLTYDRTIATTKA
jgi:alpha-galactosidase